MIEHLSILYKALDYREGGEKDGVMEGRGTIGNCY